MCKANKRRRITLLIVLVICFALCPLVSLDADESQKSFADANAKRVDAFLREHFTAGNAGMVIGLVDRDGSRLFYKGKLDSGTAAELDGDTLFEIGSITKTFTALLLLDAVRRGELKLDDPAAKHLPGTASLPSRNDKLIKLLNLAAHDAGFPPNPENFTKTDMKEAYEAYQVEDLYAFLSQHKLGSDPGEKFRYSNVGYMVLGQALQRRLGADYESLVIDRICRPLKMDDTRVVLTDDMKKRLAVGHSADGRRLTPLNMQVMAPAGALRSTARDLLKYLSANLGLIETELLEPMKTMHEIRHRGDPDYGNTALPWYNRAVYQPPDSEILGHGGGTFGFFTFIGFDRKCQRGVVVLSNQTVLNSSCVGLAILQEMPLTRGNATQLVREHLGIGVALSFDETAQRVRISTVFRKSPAAETGLTSGLLIRKINGTAVDGKRPNECFDLMRGPAGTNIRLDVVDSSGKETRVEVAKRKFLTL